ncbi:prepilin-type N-terminal cleavage/methylation do main-containing protein, precursor [Mycolicibacterium canariasense]|uniref:Prepilin-type N-terminal cleavage/methylation do main-containing protein n=2 Tax=Mycolicibacterium canariasense TaxID=228230 RepID=A0A100WG28_MYCCR|nr:prepilin-type N-terminal cleavage/methylation do main-containing protein, precursor [Mycolicibacterium canariasense]
MAHAAGAPPGAATHVSTAEVSLAAARSDLRLVFARVGDQPALGTAIVEASAKPKLEILALPPSAAAEVATKGAGAVPAAVVEAGRVAATKILADANEASLTTVTASATPTDNVLSRALQGVWNFGLWTGSSSVPPLPTGFDTKTYTSILKVLSNLVNVGLLPFTVANQVLQGQWSAIPTNITNTLNTFSTSLGRLPGSFQETLNWIINGTVPVATAATAGAVLATPAANATVSTNAAASPNATATDNVLTRALQGAWNIGLWTGSSSVPPLPTGFDTKTYTSILKVVSNLVNVGLLPFTVVNQVLQGQWSAIPTNITNTLNTFSTSLGRLPGSIGQTLHWIVTGTATTAPTVKPTTLAAGAITPVEGATTAEAVTGKAAKNPTATGTGAGTKETDTGTKDGTEGAGTGATGGGTDTGGTTGGTKDSSGTESGSTGDTKAGDTKPGDTKAGDTKAGDTKTGDTQPGDTKAGDDKAGDKDATDTTKGSTTSTHSAGSANSGTYGRHARQDDGSGSTASASTGTSTTSSTGGRHRKPEGGSSTGSSSSSSEGGEHSSAA